MSLQNIFKSAPKITPCLSYTLKIENPLTRKSIPFTGQVDSGAHFTQVDPSDAKALGLRFLRDGIGTCKIADGRRVVVPVGIIATSISESKTGRIAFAGVGPCRLIGMETLINHGLVVDCSQSPPSLRMSDQVHSLHSELESWSAQIARNIADIDPRHWISLEDILAICQAHGESVPEESQEPVKFGTSSYLEFLHFGAPDPSTPNVYALSPKWLQRWEARNSVKPIDFGTI